MYLPFSLNINVEWQTLKNTLQQAANEALGKRKKRRHRRRLIVWNEDTKNLIEKKNRVYLWYKELVATVKRETRNIKRQCWETFV